jgi:hypothetical protein
LELKLGIQGFKPFAKESNIFDSLIERASHWHDSMQDEIATELEVEFTTVVLPV